MAEHGHAPEKKHDSHESPKGGGEWLGKAFKFLSVTLLAIVAAPALLAAANVIIPQYLGTIGLMAGAYAVGADSKKSGGGGGGAHH